MTTPSDLLPRWLVEDSVNTPPHIHLASWDDGFTPSGCNGRRGQIVLDQPRSTKSTFHVLDEAVSTTTADLIYASAVRAKVWGVFVPTSQLSVQSCVSPEELQQRKDKLAQQDELIMDKERKAAYRTELGRLAVEEFLVAQAGSAISREDWSHAHGVAVWVIASDCDDETEYHLDYAEMLRYETNVIFPPMYGATLHVSPFNHNEEIDMAGGGFHVNLRGLAHYQEYGYKTRLCGGARKLTTDEIEARTDHEPGWQSVGYRYRRGIICDGEFPHFSARVRSLPPPSASNDALPFKRVVVGFNLFPHEIGAFVERFPEHSDAFNRYIKLSQTAVKTQAQQAQQLWSLESIKKNPKQAAFIKYLARKVRETQVKHCEREVSTTPAQSA